MDERSFIHEIRRIFSLAPQERLQTTIAFHQEVCENYCQAVNVVDETRVASTSSDGRMIK